MFWQRWANHTALVWVLYVLKVFQLFQPFLHRPKTWNRKWPEKKCVWIYDTTVASPTPIWNDRLLFSLRLGKCTQRRTRKTQLLPGSLDSCITVETTIKLHVEFSFISYKASTARHPRQKEKCSKRADVKDGRFSASRASSWQTHWTAVVLFLMTHLLAIEKWGLVTPKIARLTP